MTLPSSPPISAQQINVELGRAATAPFDINGAQERALAQVPSGPISFSNFLGKSSNANFSYIGSYKVTGTNSASVSFGASFSGRLIVCSISYYNGSNAGISGATIGGTSATIYTQTNFYNSLILANYGSAIIFGSPSGTSGTVSISLPSAAALLVSVFALKSPAGIQAKNATATGVLAGATASLDLSTATNGCVVACATTTAFQAGSAWSGVSQLYNDGSLTSAELYPSSAGSVSIRKGAGASGNENDTAVCVLCGASFSF